MELLPCPFCGGTDVSVAEGSTFRWVVAICNNCDASAPESRVIPNDEEKTRELALVEWNRRASPASVPADAARFNDGWTHSCNALCMEIELWIDRCPHCGRPAPKAPAMQEDKP